MDEEPRSERDVVGELHDDAEWGSWTNSIERWRGRPRGSVPRDPGARTFMLAAILVAAIVVGAVGLVVWVVRGFGS